MSEREKTASAPAVSRALGRAGHPKSVAGQPGFRVRKHGRSVSVTYSLAFFWGEITEEQRAARNASRSEALDRYAETLTEAGYTVRREDNPMLDPALYVSKSETTA